METAWQRVLIGEESTMYDDASLHKLWANGFQAKQVRRNGKAILETIEKIHPDLVIMDAILPGLDAIEVMKRAASLPKKPLFIITSTYENECLERQVMMNGASYFMRKPFDMRILMDRMKSLLAYQDQTVSDTQPKTQAEEMAQPEQALEIVVTELMHQLGVPAHIKGYHYLRTAIISSVADQTLLESVTKALYPTVAKKYRTTPQRVERAIRHAIGIAWERGDLDMIQSLFGYTIDSYKGHPTNSEFIALLTDRLVLKHGNFSDFRLVGMKK